MRTGLNNTLKAILGLTLATLSFGVAPALAQSQPVKGGERMASEFKQPAPTDAPRPGETNSCEKCKSVTVQNVTTERGRSLLKAGDKHLCPECVSKIEVIGTGRAAKTQVKHVCATSEDKNVFCCATKADEPRTACVQ